MPVTVSVTTEDGELLERLRVDWAESIRTAPGLHAEAVLAKEVLHRITGTSILKVERLA